MRQRLDQALVERGLVTTRSRARDAIQRGHVQVGGKIVNKPSALIEANDHVGLDATAAGTQYVSRAALKLIAGLDAFGFDPADRSALDIGASTGGFTQVLLERGAHHVIAVDVGTGQLHATLSEDPRVTTLESRDARTLTRQDVTSPISAIVADVSFVSLTKALGPALALAAQNCFLVALIKPQFEALTPSAIGSGGVVRNEAEHHAAIARVRSWLEAQGQWRIVGVIPSPIEGGSGNSEFLIGAVFDGG